MVSTTALALVLVLFVGNARHDPLGRQHVARGDLNLRPAIVLRAPGLLHGAIRGSGRHVEGGEALNRRRVALVVDLALVKHQAPQTTIRRRLPK